MLKKKETKRLNKGYSVSNIFNYVRKALDVGPDAPRLRSWGYVIVFWFLILILEDLLWQLRIYLNHLFPLAIYPNSYVAALFIYTPFISKVLTLILVWAFVTNLGNYSFWSSIKWSGKSGLDFQMFQRVRGLPYISLIAGVLVGLLVYFCAETFVFSIPGPKTRADDLASISPVIQLTGAIVAIALAPFIEELLYRGVLFLAARKVWEKAIVVIAGTGLFAYVHLNQYSDKFGTVHWGVMLSISFWDLHARLCERYRDTSLHHSWCI